MQIASGARLQRRSDTDGQEALHQFRLPRIRTRKRYNMTMWPAFKRWLHLAIALTGVCILIYGTVQQQYRQSLNDPQIQLARDSAAQMARDGSAVFLENWDRIDIHESLAPFVAVYDINGTAI